MYSAVTLPDTQEFFEPRNIEDVPDRLVGALDPHAPLRIHPLLVHHGNSYNRFFLPYAVIMIPAADSSIIISHRPG